MKTTVQIRARARTLFYLTEPTTVAEIDTVLPPLLARRAYLVGLVSRITAKVKAPHDPAYDFRVNQDAKTDAMMLVHGVRADQGVSDPEVAEQAGDIGLAELDRLIAKLRTRRERLVAGLGESDTRWPEGVPPPPAGPSYVERRAQEDADFVAQLRALIASQQASG
jgi:hypothetical protein